MSWWDWETWIWESAWRTDNSEHIKLFSKEGINGLGFSTADYPSLFVSSPFSVSLSLACWQTHEPCASLTGRMERKYGLIAIIALGNKCLHKGSSHLISSSNVVFSAHIFALQLSHRLDEKAPFSALWFYLWWFSFCGFWFSVVM